MSNILKIIKIEKVEQFVGNFHDKKEYIIHTRSKRKTWITSNRPHNKN